MENLEEVLQALDEFQKMRPTEIPRELEDYLCWVAKTGDPVYQWSLIKTLFREKLTRVMTDFYESCPSLDLAPCPNVEHFNYDTMKSNLLDRLESFANAPFTVQRICELLTAPRKEYNRVDKFMRAIEKNILVVSTREPGPIGRRSENGDSMVNGSIDEDSSVTQPPQDVEMEYWEKDCASTVTISVHTMENETPLLQTVIPSSTVVKNVFGPEEAVHDKIEQPSTRSESQDSTIVPGSQSMTTIVTETSGILGDVPEAIMNEDTSSQPSLDLESEECEDDNKLSEKVDVGSTIVGIHDKSTNSMKGNEVVAKSILESKADSESMESVSPVVDSLLKATDGKLRDTAKSDTISPECAQVTNEENRIAQEDKKTLIFDNTNLENMCHLNNSKDMQISPIDSYEIEKGIVINRNCQDSLTFSNKEVVPRLSHNEVESKDKSNDFKDVTSNAKHLKQRIEDAETGESIKPVVELPASKEKNSKEISKCTTLNNESLTIVEVAEEESKIVRCLVPDPIPIVEEPKDMESPNKKIEGPTPVVEVLDQTENEATNLKVQSLTDEKLKSIEKIDLMELQGNNGGTTTSLKDSESSVIENTVHKEECGSVELMEVDEESSMFQQDEPMEQETAEFSKS